jgi:hypothetical protein
MVILLKLNCEYQEFTNLYASVIPGRGLASKQLASIKELDKYGFCPGSLNLIFNKPTKLEANKCTVATFDVTQRYFWPAKIDDVDVFLYRWRGSRLHTVEVMAPVNLRSHFGLYDGATVKIEVSKKIIRPVRVRERLLYQLLWSMGRQSWPYQSELYQSFVKYLEAAAGALQK